MKPAALNVHNRLDGEELMSTQQPEPPDWVDPLIASLQTEPIDRASLISVDQVVHLVKHHRLTAGDVVDLREAASLTVQALQGNCRALSFIASRLPIFMLVDQRLQAVVEEERNAMLDALRTALDGADDWRSQASSIYVHRAGMAACFCLTEGWERRGALV